MYTEEKYLFKATRELKKLLKIYFSPQSHSHENRNKLQYATDWMFRSQKIIKDDVEIENYLPQSHDHHSKDLLIFHPS